MNNRILVYHLDSSLDSELNHSIIYYVFEIIGCKAVRASKNNREEIHLYYGNDAYKFSSNNFINVKFNCDDLIWNDLIYNSTFECDGRVVPFDIFSAIKNFLSDKIHDNKKDIFDIHDRLMFSSSYKALNGISEIPILNLYINHLKTLLKKNFDFKLEPLFPYNKAAAIVLSHDVDVPIKYALLKNYRLSPPNRNLKQFLRYQLEFFYMVLKYLFDTNRNENWVFNEIMETELKYNFKSTFFFAVTHNCIPGAFIKDVDYDIFWKEFRDVFSKIIKNNFEIGLHVSYNAYKSNIRIKEEKNILEKLCQKEIHGVRHHFWHLGKDFIKTLRMHQEAEIKYDASLAFNDSPGFRNSISLPFFPVDIKHNEQLKIMEIPTFLMDGNLLYNPKVTISEATNVSISFIDLIKKYNGVGAIDWHVRTSFPKSKKYEKWGLTYENILKYLSSDSDIWVTNLYDLHNWFLNRHKTIKNFNF